jgi:hypothetical protein
MARRIACADRDEVGLTACGADGKMHPGRKVVGHGQAGITRHEKNDQTRKYSSSANQSLTNDIVDNGVIFFFGRINATTITTSLSPFFSLISSPSLSILSCDAKNAKKIIRSVVYSTAHQAKQNQYSLPPCRSDSATPC